MNHIPERPSMRDGIKEDILNCLQEYPADFNNLLEMMNDKGYKIKCGKHTAIRGKEQKRFIQFRSLGEEFSEENLIWLWIFRKKWHRERTEVM